MVWTAGSRKDASSGEAQRIKRLAFHRFSAVRNRIRSRGRPGLTRTSEFWSRRVTAWLSEFREHVAPVFFVSFLFGLSMICLSVAGWTVFIDELGAERIPQLLIVGAIISVLIGLLDVRLSAVLTLRKRTAIVGIVLTVLALGLGIAYRLFPSPLVVFALPLAFEVMLLFSEMIVTALALDRYDMSQSKRYFGRATTGRWVGYVALGPVLTAVTIEPATLFVVAGLLSAAASMVAVAVAGGSSAVAPESPGTADASTSSSRDAIGRNPLSRSILAVTMLGVPTLLVADYIFLAQADRSLSEASLQRLLSLAVLIQGAAVLVGSYSGGAFIRRYGVGAGLLSVPVVVAILSVAMLGSLAAGTATATLVIAIMINAGEPMLRYGLRRPATALLYQPLPESLVTRVQSLTDGAAVAAMIVLTGLALTVLDLLGPSAVLLGTLLVIGATLVATVVARRRYVDALRSALERRQLGSGVTFAKETREVLTDGLDDSDPGKVLAAARLITDIDPNGLRGESDRLLTSKHSEVRSAALTWAERGVVAPDSGALHLIVGDQNCSPHDRIRALGLARRSGHSWVDEMVAQLTASEEFADAAVVQSTDSAERHRMAEVASASPDRERRLRCAEVLVDAGDLSDVPVIMRLLTDEDPEVRRMAAAAASRIDDAELWEFIFSEVGPRMAGDGLDLRDPIGDAPVDALVGAIDRARDEELSPLLRVALSSADDRVLAAVERVAGRPDPLIREMALAGLARREHHVPASRSALLRSDLDRIAVGCLALVGVAGRLRGPLRDAVDHAVERERRSLLHGVTTLGFGTEAQAVSAAVASGTPNRTAHANEWLRTSLPGSDRRLVEALEASSATLAATDHLPEDLDPHGLDRWITLLAKHQSGDRENSNMELPVAERVIALRAAEMFAETPPAILLELAEHAAEHRLENGATLFEQGDEGDELYVLLDGEIGIYVGDRKIDALQAGDAFGELALICGERRSASARAVDSALLLSISRQHFFELQYDRPEVSILLLRYVADRLRRRTLA